MDELRDEQTTVWHGSEQPVPSSVGELTEAVITALTEWNSAALDQLARQAAAWIENPPARSAVVAAQDQHRLLGALLQETERNLRMFRETSPCVEFLPWAGVYQSRWS